MTRRASPAVCDLDGSPLVQRADDRPRPIRARLAHQLAADDDVVDYYRPAGVLATVDGRPPIETSRPTCSPALARRRRVWRSLMRHPQVAPPRSRRCAGRPDRGRSPGPRGVRAEARRLDRGARPPRREPHPRGRGSPVVQGLLAHPRSTRSRRASASRSTTRSSTAFPGERLIRDGQIVSDRRRRDPRRLARRRGADVHRRRAAGRRSPSSSTRPALAMMAGIAAAVPGSRLGDIWAAIEDVARARRLRHRPPVRRPRHRDRDAPGAAGPELPDRRPRA